MRTDATSTPCVHVGTGGAFPARNPTHNPLRILVDTLLTWQARATERGQLAALDPHLRKDLGLSEAKIAEEVRKPFWQA